MSKRNMASAFLNRAGCRMEQEDADQWIPSQLVVEKGAECAVYLDKYGCAVFGGENSFEVTSTCCDSE